MDDLIVIGGGLAGCEAAWQVAERGINVTLYEMRPAKQTPVHKTSFLAEMVCSNSLGSVNPDRPAGLLKYELNLLNSLLLKCANQFKLPAGSSLSVDREHFSKFITQQLQNHPRITIIRSEIKVIPQSTCIISSGPLTSDSLAERIQQLTGKENLFFYDAIAPRMVKEDIDFSIAFFGSRYGQGDKLEGDYINCPFTKKEYEQFVSELCIARCVVQNGFEKSNIFFEACLPIEQIARRSKMALAFGPMRPVGITNPHAIEKPFALVQLRQDDMAGEIYNLVGFQTNLSYSEQDRIFHMIPGLKNTKIIQYGQMHRNTFICSPRLLLPTLQTRFRRDLLFAGQIAGFEGYLGSVASGLVAGINAARLIKGQSVLFFPPNTMIGSLCNYISFSDSDHFQPIKANFGLLAEFPEKIRSKTGRSHQKTQRALQEMKQFIEENAI